jgi:hypothetical protein
VANQDSPSSVIACNTNAILAAERPWYNDLMKRLRLAIRDRSRSRWLCFQHAITSNAMKVASVTDGEEALGHNAHR